MLTAFLGVFDSHFLQLQNVFMREQLQQLDLAQRRYRELNQ